MGVDRSRRINGEFKINDRIGHGAFGEVYRVEDRDGHYRAAKFVSRCAKKLLEKESQIMPKRREKRLYGTIYQYFYGRHGDHYVLVMDLLGRSIWDLDRQYGGLSRKTALMLGIQMTRRVKELHERGFIHRDIKPDNFVMGRKLADSKYVYLIDYGFAQKFREIGNRHTAKTTGHRFVGTVEFASKHSHRGDRQSRRSDLESVVYSLVYLFRGSLPWDGANNAQATKIKEEISAGDLCYGCPDELKYYYRYVRDLSFTERPDYSKLRGYLESAVGRYGYSLDNKFEWT